MNQVLIQLWIKASICLGKWVLRRSGFTTEVVLHWQKTLKDSQKTLWLDNIILHSIRSHMPLSIFLPCQKFSDLRSVLSKEFTRTVHISQLSSYVTSEQISQCYHERWDKEVSIWGKFQHCIMACSYICHNASLCHSSSLIRWHLN